MIAQIGGLMVMLKQGDFIHDVMQHLNSHAARSYQLRNAQEVLWDGEEHNI